jgi:hypothetical protein
MLFSLGHLDVFAYSDEIYHEEHEEARRKIKIPCIIIFAIFVLLRGEN